MPDRDVNELMSSLAGQAQAERDRILSDARRAAEETLKAAEAEALSLEEKAERELERGMGAEKERVLGKLRMEEGNRRLAAKRKAVRRAFEGAGERISDLCRSGQYPGVLERLIGEAVSALGGGGELVVSEADRELCERIVERLGLSCSVRGEGDEPGTAIALSPDGARKVDNSLRVRLERAMVVIEPAVSRILFDTLDEVDGIDEAGGAEKQ